MKKKSLSKRKLSLKKTPVASLKSKAGSTAQAMATFNCWRTIYECKA